MENADKKDGGLTQEDKDEGLTQEDRDILDMLKEEEESGSETTDDLDSVEFHEDIDTKEGSPESGQSEQELGQEEEEDLNSESGVKEQFDDLEDAYEDLYKESSEMSDQERVVEDILIRDYETAKEVILEGMPDSVREAYEDPDTGEDKLARYLDDESKNPYDIDKEAYIRLISKGIRVDQAHREKTSDHVKKGLKSVVGAVAGGLGGMLAGSMFGPAGTVIGAPVGAFYGVKRSIENFERWKVLVPVDGGKEIKFESEEEFVDWANRQEDKISGYQKEDEKNEENEEEIISEPEKITGDIDNEASKRLGFNIEKEDGSEKTEDDVMLEIKNENKLTAKEELHLRYEEYGKKIKKRFEDWESGQIKYFKEFSHNDKDPDFSEEDFYNLINTGYFLRKNSSPDGKIKISLNGKDFVDFNKKEFRQLVEKIKERENAVVEDEVKVRMDLDEKSEEDLRLEGNSEEETYRLKTDKESGKKTPENDDEIVLKLPEDSDKKAPESDEEEIIRKALNEPDEENTSSESSKEDKLGEENLDEVVLIDSEGKSKKDNIEEDREKAESRREEVEGIDIIESQINASENIDALCQLLENIKEIEDGRGQKHDALEQVNQIREAEDIAKRLIGTKNPTKHLGMHSTALEGITGARGLKAKVHELLVKFIEQQEELGSSEELKQIKGVLGLSESATLKEVVKELNSLYVSIPVGRSKEKELERNNIKIELGKKFSQLKKFEDETKMKGGLQLEDWQKVVEEVLGQEIDEKLISPF